MIDLPRWDLFMIPTLRAMEDGQIRERAQIYPAVADLMGLTQDQKIQTHEKSGGIAFHTRIGFGLSFLQNVGALDRIETGTYRFTDAGRQVLEKFPEQATEKELLAWAEEEGSPIRPYVPGPSRKEQTRKTVNKPPTKAASRKFELAMQFLERVLEQHRSFLWPNEEGVWTAENATQALDLIRPLAGLGYGDAFSQLVTIARAAPRPIFQIICDIRAVSVINRRLVPETATRQMSMFIESLEEFDGDRQVLATLVSSAEDHFPGIAAYHNNMIDQIITVFTGVLACIRDPNILGNRDQMCEAFYAEVPNEQEEFFHFPVWSLYYLMYPGQFASVPTWNHRNAVFKGFQSITEGHEFPNEMSRLSFIRENLDPDFDPYTFDFYASPWKERWQKGKEWEEAQGGEPNGTSLPHTPPTIADLAAATHLNEAFLREIEALLKDKKQLIFEGPPGSGKTFVADKFARYFTGQPLDSDETNEQIELVQFHQSYSYEDFVEGIRPRTNDAGQLIYDVEPGVFREFAACAQANPDKPFVLIIDEINRGNVSRILGELMLLLEYRDKSARLPYSKTYLRIPKNLYIIGTMNSADRSLSQIDYALRRRFYFVRFMSVENNIAQVLQSWLNINDIDSTRVLPLFLRLNALLEEHVGTDDLQVGHSYFMREGINLEAVQEQVWKYAVMPLLREYLYHHRERDTVLAKFELLRVGAPPMAIAEPSIDVGSGRDADVDAFADVPNHE